MVFRVFFVISDAYAVRFLLRSYHLRVTSSWGNISHIRMILRDSATDIKKTYRKSAPSESDLIEV